MSFDSTVHAKAVELTRLCYEMAAEAGSGHPTSAASLAHIVTVLMYQHMRWEPANPSHPASDRLVLSEGHAVPIVYAASADQGVVIGSDRESQRPMTVDDAMTLRAIDSVVEGHPNPIVGFPFFDAATGSLGQGLSVAAGLAAAARLDSVDRRFFCIIGDGEAREGQNWEALDMIRDYGLNAVCPIFNANEFGQSDPISPQQSADSIVAKVTAAGFNVLAIDGHNPTAIAEALSSHAQSVHDPEAPPIALVARTIKGWGSPSQQGPGHHGQAAKGQEKDKVIEELEQTGRELGATADMSLRIPAITARKPQQQTGGEVMTFTQAATSFDMSDMLEKRKMATRRAYGLALRALGQVDPNVVALDADVKNSTFSEVFCKDEQLRSRFFECRIAEQNMVSFAVGLGAGGRVPFASTFAKFMMRACDQIEMAVNSGVNFKLVGSHAGISLAADGPSQMGLPDVAFFRTWTTMRRSDGEPGFYVLNPSDALQAYALTMLMAEYCGPCYLRTMRPDVEFLYNDGDQFQLGGHEVLTQGRDLLILASGYMVHEANKALEKLDSEGIDATLVDLYSIPFDTDAILDLANQNNGYILTVEDNYGGGFGSVVAEAAAADGGGFTVRQMHVRRVPKSGRTPDDVLAYCGLSADHIVKEAMVQLQLTAI
ncbi:MAG: transketolase [Pirellulaceae bacterium]|nr:transketolase [Pirellulaceae bacterium]